MRSKKSFKIVKLCLLGYNTFILFVVLSYFYGWDLPMTMLLSTGIGVNFAVGMFMMLKDDVI